MSEMWLKRRPLGRCISEHTKSTKTPHFSVGNTQGLFYSYFKLRGGNYKIFMEFFPTRDFFTITLGFGKNKFFRNV